MTDLHIADNLQVNKPIVIRAMTIEIRGEGSWRISIYSEKSTAEEDNEGYYNSLVF